MANWHDLFAGVRFSVTMRTYIQVERNDRHRMMRKRLTLRAAMMLLVVLAIAPVAIFLTIQNVAAHRNAIADAFSNTTGLALKLASHPKEVLPEPKAFISNLSQLHELTFPLDCDGLQNIADAAKKIQPYLVSVAVFSATGDRVCPYPAGDENVTMRTENTFSVSFIQRRTRSASCWSGA